MHLLHLQFLALALFASCATSSLRQPLVPFLGKSERDPKWSIASRIRDKKQRTTVDEASWGNYPASKPSQSQVCLSGDSAWRLSSRASDSLVLPFKRKTPSPNSTNVSLLHCSASTTQMTMEQLWSENCFMEYVALFKGGFGGAYSVVDVSLTFTPEWQKGPENCPKFPSHRTHASQARSFNPI